MRVAEVEVREVRLPLVTPFRSALGTDLVRRALLVRIITADGVEGWGECVAMAEPTYTEEWLDGARTVLDRFLVPAVLAADGIAAAGLTGVFGGVVGHPMAKAAVEAAVLDAELREAGESLATHLGAVRDRVEAGVAIGITASVAELLDLVAGYLEKGYRRVKLKIQPGWDVEPVVAIRGRFGDGPLVQVDANRSYTLDGWEALAALDPFGLALIEQPLAADDLLGHAALAGRIATPICLDESITSARVAALAIELGACSVVCVKPGRVGGLLEAKRVHDVCVARGVPVWCGGMLETGIGRAANVALAALPGFSLPGDLSASARYFDRDVTPPFELEDGCLRVPTGPGIGVEPDPAALADLTTETRRYQRA